MKKNNQQLKNWEHKKISDFLDYERPDEYIVKNTHYSNNYKIPVLTANKGFVLGYTDEDFGIYHDLPVIIFDDFTTDMKYVDFPFKVKSSAMKMLKPKSKDVNLKFVYELMKFINFQPSNHRRYYISQYQNLEVLIPRDKNEQKKIADILGSADEDIKKTEEIILKTEELKKGLIQKLLTKGIGHTKFKKTKLGEICNFTTGKLNSNKATEGGRYPFFTCSQETFKIGQYSFDQKAILLAGNNAAGKYSVKYYDGKFDAYQRTYVISVRNEKETSYQYIRQVLSARLNELRDSSVGTTTKFLTLNLLQNLPVMLPSIYEQKRIAKILSAVDDKILIYKNVKNKLTNLKKGLMKDLLSGEVKTN